MALNIPMPESPGSSLLKGLSTGSDMYHKLMLSKYYGQLHPSGDVANALYVEQLKGQYGENDPRYLQAKAAHDMTLQGHQSLMDYRTQLSNLAPYRAATPEEKLIAAGQGKGVLQTFGGNGRPGGQQQQPQGGASPQRASAGMVSGDDGHAITQSEADVYNRALGKKTSDAGIRNKIPYAENVETTFNNLNPEDLTTYSGIKGSLEYGKDFVKAGLGNPSDRFLKHAEAVNTASMLSKQLRQFWSDSIQPSATDKIDALTNPSKWNKDPKVAQAQLAQLKRITDQELATMKKAGTSPMQFQGTKKLEFKDGKFVIKDRAQGATAADETVSGFSPQDEDMALTASFDLTNALPEATPENILETAKASGKSVKEVVDHLHKQAQRMQGGQ